MREAARHGLRTLLPERGDFASGTSSRSSQLIHGGLHYLMGLEVGMVRRASLDRNRLVAAGAGLVDTVEFFIPPDGLAHVPRCVARGLVAAYGAISGGFPVDASPTAGSASTTPAPTTRGWCSACSGKGSARAAWPSPT